MQNKQESLSERRTNKFFIGSEFSFSKKKGQTQSVLILLGVIILVVVVILFATNRISLQPPEPEAITQAKEELRFDIENSIKSYARDVIQTVAEQGGYWSTDSQPASLTYKGSDVAYWLFGNQVIKRSRQDFGVEISRGLKEVLADLDPSEFSRKSVASGPIQNVETEITKNSVVVKVYMPVSLEGYTLRSPFEVSIPVKLGEAIDFANEVLDKNLAQETIKLESPGANGTVTTYAVKYPDGVFRDALGNVYSPSDGTLEQNRFFERFIIGGLVAYQRLGFDGQPRIPTIGIIEGCGKFIHKDWFDVKPEMEDFLRGTLRNTYIAGEGNAVFNISDKSSYPANVLPVVSDLDVKFDLGSELDEISFQMYPNPLDIRTSAPQYVPICFSNPYKVNYRMFFPVVAEVKDEGLDFKFAFMVYIEGYEPGDLNAVGVDLNLDYYNKQLELCQNALCTADLEIVDINGPVEGALVVQSGCNLGRTDSNGKLEARIPCGIGTFEVRDADHKIYSDLKSSDELETARIFISRRPTSTFHLYNLEIEKISGDPGNVSGTYKVNDVVANSRESSIVIEFETETFSETFSQTTDGDVVVTDSVPAGEITMTSVVKEGDQDLGGLITYSYITEFDQDYWVYIPVLKGGISTPNTGEDAVVDQFLNLAVLTNIAALCGQEINRNLPVSSVEADINKLKECVVTL